MAKAKKVAPSTKETDIKEFFEALTLIGEEKGIPLEDLVDKIKTAIALAVKKGETGNEESIVEIDPETKRFYVAIRKEVVEEVETPATQITLEDAVKYDKKARVGEMVEIPLETKKFGRIAAQSAKHVIRQGIREAEKGLLFQEFRSREHDIVTATVIRCDPKTGAATLEIGNSQAILPRSEQIYTEETVNGEKVRHYEPLEEGQKIRVYVMDALNGEKGPRLMISRTHPKLVKRLFEMQVPEIYDSVVEIKAISREAGSRSKLAVISRDENVDPVGACIGHCGGAGGRKNRCGAVQRGSRQVHLRGPFPRHGSFGGDRGGQHPQLPGHGAGSPAESRHWQQGPERPPCGQAHRVEDRYSPGKRLLRRRRGRVTPADRKTEGYFPLRGDLEVQ